MGKKMKIRLKKERRKLDVQKKFLNRKSFEKEKLTRKCEKQRGELN